MCSDENNRSMRKFLLVLLIILYILLIDIFHLFCREDKKRKQKKIANILKDLLNCKISLGMFLNPSVRPSIYSLLAILRNMFLFLFSLPRLDDDKEEKTDELTMLNLNHKSLDKKKHHIRQMHTTMLHYGRR